jgi:hypothetical protein
MTEQEQYQQYLKDQADYQEYLKEQGMAGSVVDQVVNEQPEGLKGRMLVKNFGGDPRAVYATLKKLNPDFEFGLEPDGEIKARKKGTEMWGRLDPKGLDKGDLGDILFDILAAVAQGAATAAGGIAGGLPGAAAASGAAGTGIEALRQAIGGMAGMGAENMSGKDIAMVGGMSTLSPLIFGSGASNAQIVKGALNQGKLVDEMANSQRGYLSKAAGWTGKQVGSMLGGYRPETLQAGADNIGIIKAAKDHPEVAVQLLTEGKGKILGGVQQGLSETGQKLETLTGNLDNQGMLIPTKDILAPIEKMKEQLRSKGIQSPERIAKVAEIDNLIKQNFGVKQGEELVIPEFVNASTANEMYFTLKEMATSSGTDLSKIGTLKGAIKPGAMSDMRTARALTTATKNAKDSVSKVAQLAGVGEEYNQLNSTYSELKKFQETFQNATKDEEAYQRFLNKRGATSRFAKQKVSNLIGEDVQNLGDKMQAIELFSDPSWQIPALGNSNTGRTLGASAIGGGLGYMYGRENEGNTFLPTMAGAFLGSKAVSPMMIRKYLEMNALAREAPKLPVLNQIYKGTPYMLMRPDLTIEKPEGE